MLDSLKQGWSDIHGALRMHEAWTYKAWLSTRQRYSRSLLGRIWISASLIFMVIVIGPLYSHLMKRDFSDFAAHLAIGMMLWIFISSVVIESGECLTQSKSFILEFNIPLSVYVFEVLMRNFIILGQNIVVVGIFLSFFGTPKFGFDLIFTVLAMIVLLVNLFCMGLFVALVSARFHDFLPLVRLLLTICFYLAPILWSQNHFGASFDFLIYNPVYLYVESVRAPLIGEPVQLKIWTVLIGVTIMLALVSFHVCGRYRKRIAYWL